MMKKLLTLLLLSISISAFTQIPNYVPTNGLVGWWPFNGNANDESGNGNNGTVNGATLTTDRFGNASKAYNFDGVNNYISVIRNYSSSFSISVWFNPINNQMYNPLIDAFDSNWEIQLKYSNPDYVSFTGVGYQEFISSQSTSNNAWYHLVCTYSTNTVVFYLNGNPIEQFSVNPIPNNSGNYFFGASLSGSDQFYYGKQDDIGIWNRALTQQEVTNLYTSTTPVSCLPSYLPTNGLVGYWPFCGNANDESGNGNNGTVNGATLTTDRFGNANKAYSFDGVNDFINVPDNTTLDLVNDFTISTWLNPNNFGIVNMILSKHDVNQGSNAGTYAMGLWEVSNNNLVNFQAAPNYNPSTYPGITGAVLPNSWRNFVVSYNKSSGLLTYYLDNTQIFSTFITFTIQNTNEPLRIGANFNLNTLVNLFSGSIDDIGIWNRILTPQEITNIYTGTLPSPTCAVSASDSTICAGQTVTLTSNPTNFSSASDCSSSSLPSNLQTGLVGYWPFCGNANDASGNGNNGSVHGATLTTDRFGNSDMAYSFDGVDDWIETMNYFLQTNNPHSISIWWKTSDSLKTNQTLFNTNPHTLENLAYHYSSSSSNPPFGLSIGMGNGLSGVGSWNILWPDTCQISTPYISGNWHLITWVKSGNYNWKVYFDASLIYTFNSVTNTGNQIANLRFGAENNGFPTGGANLVGKLDDIGVWNRALTVSEIQQLYTQGQTAYSWSNGATTPSITVSPTTTTTFSCTVTNNGVSCTDDVTIVVDTPPTPIITASGSTSICSGGSVTLTSSSATGNVWSTGATSQSIVVSAAGNNSVTVTNATGCSATSATTAISVNPLPSVNAGVDQTVCAGTSVTLSGAGATTYSWNNSVSNGVAFTPVSTGTYTVTGTNSATGCTNTDQVVVNVNALPSVNAGADHIVCAGVPVTLTGSGATNYSWNNNVTNGVSFLPVSSGTYTVTGTNANGCTNTDQVEVVIIPLPLVNAGADQTICAGSSITLNGTGAVSYSWNNGVVNGVAFTPTATTTYSLTGTNEMGCTWYDQVLVTVNPLPTVNAGSDQMICAGTPITLNGSGANTYSWDNGVSNGIAFVPVGSTTYTVTGTDANGCTNTDAVFVMIHALPSVNAGADQSVCEGTTVTLSASGAVTYTWNNNVSNGTAFTPTATTTYLVSGMDGNGCSNSDQVVVTVNPLPNVNAGTDQALCQGESTSLFGTGANTYSWSNNVVNGVGFLPTTTQAYTVTGTNTTTGCTNSDTVTVTVNLLPTVNAGTDQTICKGDALTLTGTGASTYSWDNNVSNGVAFNPIATATYTVSGTDANGCTNSDQVIVTVNEATVSTLTESAVDSYTLNGQTYTQSGTYTQVIPNAAGCDSTITLNLTLSFTGIPEIGETNIMVYPNPTNDLLNIILPTESAVNYVLLDSRGRKVLEGSFFGTENQISLKACTPGAYFLKIGQKEVPIRVIKQ